MTVRPNVTRSQTRKQTRTYRGELLTAIRLLVESLTALSETTRLQMVMPPKGCNRCFAETLQHHLSSEGRCPRCQARRDMEVRIYERIMPTVKTVGGMANLS